MATRSPIDWDVAQKVASRIAGREPFSSSYLGESLEADFVELTAQAEGLVASETGLRSSAGPARVRVASRATWVAANLASFRRMLAPLTDRLAIRMANSPVAFVGRRATGTQFGVVLGWMSTRVLGQYDILLAPDDHPEEQDFIYYLAPNVLALEKRYAFPPREFRLWLALHECTHRAQFTGVPWLTEYFKAQVDALIGQGAADTEALMANLKRVAKEIKAGNNPLNDNGILGAVATPEQQQSIKRIYGLMALLEGHGEVTMARAGADLIPSAERFHRVLHNRRSSARGLTKVMQRLLGMEAKLRQYADGAAFIEAVEAAGGQSLFCKVWEAPEYLPTADEIKDPQIWISRVNLPSPAPTHDG